MGFPANWITLLLVSGESFSWFIYLIRQIQRNLLVCINLAVITKCVKNSSVNSAYSHVINYCALSVSSAKK